VSDDAHLYRPGVGILLLNARREAFVAQRIDNPGPAWQMPQGGLEQGESPEVGALRELEEETSIGPDKVAVLAEMPTWQHYDLPTELTGRLWKGKYRGQRQKWFCGVFLGQDSDVDLAIGCPEFSSWKWVPVPQIVDLIVPFKRNLYREIVQHFRPFWAERPL